MVGSHATVIRYTMDQCTFDDLRVDQSVAGWIEPRCGFTRLSDPRYCVNGSWSCHVCCAGRDDLPMGTSVESGSPQ